MAEEIKTSEKILEKEKHKSEEENKENISLLEDLSSLESYARELFSFSPLPICFASPIGVILEINPAFERLSGFGAYEIIGEPIENFFRKDDVADFSKETLEKGFVKERELHFNTKEKGEILVSAFSQIRKVKEGETIGYFISFFDLTEVKKSEVELKNSQTALLNMLEDVEQARKKSDEERNKTVAIVTNLADGLLVFDTENNLSTTNPLSEKIFDIKGRDVVGRSFRELETFPTMKPLIEILEKNSKKQLFREELNLREDMILEVSSVFMTSEEKRTGTLVVLHNITREKVVEKMKSEFVSLAAHQLRTPLSAIKWTLSMLLDGDLGTLTQDQRSFLEKTYTSNERMITLINDLLDSTRIEEGRYVYRPILSDIKTQVQTVVDNFQEEIKKRGLKIEIKIPNKDLPKVRIDEEKIRLVVENFLDNAIKYSSIGGVLGVVIEKGKNEIKVSVSNLGIGIAEEQKKRVFSKFFRGSNAIKTETEGTGLGLFISKNIIEAHGGQIGFESEEGKQTTFFFTIPIKEEFEEFLKDF